MFLIVNHKNIILDAVPSLQFKRLDPYPPLELFDVEEKWEATHIVGSDGTIYMLMNTPIFGFDNAVYVTDEYDLPEDFEPGCFTFNPETTEIQPIYKTAEEKREHAYNTRKLINYDNKSLTVTEASQLWQYYHSEENPKYKDLEELIINAKTQIREQIGE